jgi:ABC-type Na+ efflux pump permease subunit
MIRTVELIIAALIVLILLIVVVGLILIIAHVYLLTQRLHSMKEPQQGDEENL